MPNRPTCRKGPTMRGTSGHGPVPVRSNRDVVLGSEDIDISEVSHSPSPASSFRPAPQPLLSAKMRLPYTSNPPQPTTAADEAIVARIQARRAPRPLQPLDLTLLHSAPVADGWNSFLGAVRTQTVLSADVRELAISRVAVVNRAWYEWAHHAPLAVAGGVSQTAMEVVKSSDPLGGGAVRPEALTEKQWAVLVYADEMTRNVEVRDETFTALKGLFNDREIVEITATVSGLCDLSETFP